MTIEEQLLEIKLRLEKLRKAYVYGSTYTLEIELLHGDFPRLIAALEAVLASKQLDCRTNDEVQAILTGEIMSGAEWVIPEGPMADDAAFIVKAVNTNAVLREVIRVQRSALEECRIIKEPTPDETFHRIKTRARQALEETERLVEKAGEKDELL